MSDPESSPPVTQLLQDWRKGDKTALDQLVPIVYSELHKMAGHYLRKERAEHTLQPTALIHEAYLRLVGQDMPDWKSRTHFFGVAAHVMRQVLVDHARKHRASKRGGSRQKVTLEDAIVFSRDSAEDFLALDEALTALAQFDPRKCRVIELRFFAGMSVEEMAEELGISVATIGRDLRLAQAWLKREMSK
jgi:RNA polymerase sigma-70 factor (ECF subfamily)